MTEPAGAYAPGLHRLGLSHKDTGALTELTVPLIIQDRMSAALIPGAAAYAAYSFMQRALGAARVSVVLYLGPLYSAGVGWAVLGEPVHLFHAVGAALIVPGIWLSTRR